MAKILIIDDDPRLIKELRDILKDEGHEIISALGGAEGLDLAKVEKPNLMILDVMMPGMDGFEVARAVREDEAIRGIPILMLTAIKYEMGLDFKKEAGNEVWLPVDDYCDKPVTPAVLIEKVEKLLQQGRKTQTVAQ